MRTHLALAAATVTLASVGWAQSGVAGLNGGLPPKIMIIFDTSNSMRNLPSFDPSSGASIPSLTGRGTLGLDYVNDDWDPNNPTAPCDNRFCIGKRTLYSVIPGYANDLQLGLAGYYQYRTRFLLAGGQTQCVYDVMAGAGTTRNFSSLTSGLGSTTAVPPPLQALCTSASNPLHQYPITLVSTSAGSAVSCTLYRGNYTNATETPTTGNILEGISGCGPYPSVTFTKGSINTLLSGGGTAATSPLFIRVAQGSSCPAVGSTLYVGSDGSNDDIGYSSWGGSPAISTSGGQGLFTDSGGGFNALPFSSRTGAFAWASNCRNGGNSGAKYCRLTLSGSNGAGNETSSVTIWRRQPTAGAPHTDPASGATFSAGGTTYTWNSGTRSTTTITRANVGGVCKWNDNTNATATQTRILTDPSALAGFGSVPGGTNCSSTNPHNGCEVTFDNQGTTTVTGTWNPLPPTVYTNPGGATVGSSCTANGMTSNQNIGYTLSSTQNGVTISKMAFGSLTAACSGSITVTGSTYLSRSLSWPGTVFACSAGSPCALDNGADGTTVTDPNDYYQAMSLGDEYRLTSSSPSAANFSIARTSYSGTCAAPGIYTNTFTGCSPATPCNITASTLDNSSGAPTTSDSWFANDIIPYQRDVGGTMVTFTSAANQGTVNSVLNFVKPGATCPATFTSTSPADGVITSGISGACSATRPCRLTFQTEECYDVSGSGSPVATACPTPGSSADALTQRRCVYSAVKYRYDPPFIGQCVYSRQLYKYERPVCAFRARSWGSNTPADCSATVPGICNFSLSSYSYRYNDPFNYCRVTGESVVYSGMANTVYNYSYPTKGGEFLGTAAVTPSRPSLNATIKTKLEERNFCEVQPEQYSSFSSACPETVNSGNATALGLATECGTAGRTCKLRWRRSATGADGGVYADGRVSYAQPNQPTYEALDLNQARCLTPDRPSGETTSPTPASMLTATDPAGSLAARQEGSGGTYWGGGWNTYPNGSTWFPVGAPGKYTLYARSKPQQAGGDVIKIQAKLRYNLGAGGVDINPTSAAVVSTTVPTGQTEVIAWNFIIPSVGITQVRVQFNFTNDYYVPPDDRNWEIAGTTGSTEIVDNRSVWLEKRPDDFCWGTGSNIQQIRLRSDWYEPSASNPASLPNAAVPYATSMNNQANKVSGWSRRGDGDAGELFIEMAAGSTNVDAFKKALSACVRPDSLTAPLDGGLCWADQKSCGPVSTESCQSTAVTDFTPLFGSLSNAYDYMAQQLAADDATQYECRDYYVLLITDGFESTPANGGAGYSNSDLISAVDRLRAVDAGTRTKNVQTFVIGFGAGLSGGDGGAGQLDLMARTGGTAMQRVGSQYTFDPVGGFALSAVNSGELADSLSIVLNNVTAGRFSRSRPALTTDGNRLYQTYFDRGASDGGTQRELLGNMVAYQLDVGGGVSSAKWEWRDKVDRQAPGSPRSPNTPVTRQFRTWIPYNDGGFSGPQSFDPTNTAVTGYIDSVAGANASPGTAVVRFARNDGLGSHADESYSGGLLKRTSRAGAVAFSGPVAVGRSPFPNSYGGSASEASSTSYSAFKTAFDNRPQRVIIGGWDGILRGVMDRTSTGSDCTVESDPGCKNGAEAWSIVPPEALKRLYDVRYTELGRVDGPTAVADVCWHSSGDAKNCTAADWRTVMISSLRQGGQEIATFDITDAGMPSLLWRFNDNTDLVDGSDDDLGDTYAPPMVGRVTVDGKKKWVGFFGGGRGSGTEGDGIYVLDMQNGQPRMGTGSDFRTKWDDWDNSTAPNTDVVGRAALYKRAGLVDVESAYFGAQAGYIVAMRTWDTDEPKDKWKPKIFYDPWSNSSRPDVYGNSRAPIYYLDKTTGQRLDTECQMDLGSGGSPASWLNVSTHPAYISNCNQLGTRRPFYNRPRVAAVYDTSKNKPDLYVGTGDINNLNADINPSSPERNFFFAIHDRKFPLGSTPSFSSNEADGSGRTMWVYMFDKNEKVISEPTFVGGSVVVATYVQPQRACRALGDSYLYAFDPRDGTPRRSLEDPANPGAYVPVVRLQNVGILSDLVSANGSIYYSTAVGNVRRTVVRQVGVSGKVQGWRRVR